MVSGYVCIVSHPLPGLTTKTTFLTSVLYIVIKLASVFMTTNAEPGEYHSGYVFIRMQFNDIDRHRWDKHHLFRGQVQEEKDAEKAGEFGLGSVKDMATGTGTGTGGTSTYSYGAISATEEGEGKVR